MTADIAALGLSVDSAQVSRASAELQTFGQSARGAEQASQTFARGSSQAAAATAQLAQRVQASVSRAEALERGLTDVTRQSGLASYQMTNLAFQINDVATMAAMGAEPLRILASQGGQFYQILASSQGGVSGGLADLASRLAALVTPARLVFGGIAAGAAAAVISLTQYLEAQREVQLALVGTGSAAGLTAQSIDLIATRAANARQATVGEAREMALAFAATGQVGDEIAAKAIAMGRNVGKIFGESSTEAAVRLARALADPAKGLDDLDKRLSAFDDATAEHIRNLSAVNDRLSAQRLLLENVGRATQVASEMTSGWEYAWRRVYVEASKLWDLLGRNVARELGLESMTQRVDTLKKEIAELSTNWWGYGETLNRVNIASKTAELQRLTTALNLMNQGLAANRDSRVLGDSIRSVVPDLATLQGLNNELAKLRSLAQQPGTFERVDATTAANLGRALEIRQAQIAAFKTAMGLAQEEHDLEMRRIAARTPAERAELVYLETRNRLMRSGQFTGNEAEQAAAFSRTQMLAQASEDLRRSQEQQLLSASQRTSLAALELKLVGQNAEVQDRVRAQAELRNQAEQEALRLYGNKDAYDKKHLAALQEEAAMQARINQEIRSRTLMQDIQFERDQMSRTAMESEVYNRLRSAGMLTNGEIQGAAAEAAAAQIRLNYTIRESINMSKDFASGFVRDLMAGKTATEALANSLNRLAQKLMDLALDNAFSALLGGGGGTNALGGLLGGALKPGGAASVPTFHSGGVAGVNDNNPRRLVSTSAFAGAPRYHSGGIAGLRPGEVPAILQRGEVVLPVGGAMRGGGGVSVPVQISIDARGAEQASVNQLIATVQDLKDSLPREIVRTVRQAQDRKVI